MPHKFNIYLSLLKLDSQGFVILLSIGLSNSSWPCVLSGYKYGKDVVPFSKIDEEQMRYKTEAKCLAVLGFTEQKHILVQELMDDQAHFVVPQNDDAVWILPVPLMHNIHFSCTLV